MYIKIILNMYNGRTAAAPSPRLKNENMAAWAVAWRKGAERPPHLVM
jgi:hypothetical protein